MRNPNGMIYSLTIPVKTGPDGIFLKMIYSLTIPVKTGPDGIFLKM
jgi:hypothetical protein